MIFHDHEYPSISINQIISPSNISNMHHYAPNDKAIHLHLQGVWSEIRPKRWATAASARSRPPGDTVTWLVTLEQSLDRPKSSKSLLPVLGRHLSIAGRCWQYIGISPGWHRCTGRRCPGWRELLCSGCHLCHRPGWDTWPNVAMWQPMATINHQPSPKPSWLVPPWNLDLVLWLPPTSRILWATGINEASWRVKRSASSRSDQAGTTRKELTCLPIANRQP